MRPFKLLLLPLTIATLSGCDLEALQAALEQLQTGVPAVEQPESPNPVAEPQDPQTPVSDPVSDQPLSAGADVTRLNDSTITLQASAQNSVANLQWRQISGDRIALKNSDTLTPSFHPAYLPHGSQLVFEVKAQNSDGSNLQDQVIVTLEDQLHPALKDGDVFKLPANENILYDRITGFDDVRRQRQIDFVTPIFGDSEIHFNPGKSAQFLLMQESSNATPLIIGEKKRIFAAINDSDDQRQLAISNNLFRLAHLGNQFEILSQIPNMMSWLLQRDLEKVSSNLKVLMVNMDNTNFNQTKAWFAEHYPNWQVTRCDINANNCAEHQADLIITGSITSASNEAIDSFFASAKRGKVPTLYVHQNGYRVKQASHWILDHFGMTMPALNSTGNLRVLDKAQWSNAETMFQSASTGTGYRRLAEHFKDRSFSTDVATCREKCDAAFYSEFYNAANDLKKTIAGIDQKNLNIFEKKGYDIEKLMILLGDKFRQQIQYPMDAINTDKDTFLRAYYADMSVYNSRKYNPIQPDLGNFSHSNFDHITPINKTRTLISKPKFRAAGVYAIPGKTVRVTRLDNSEETTSVFINTQRSGSTHAMDKNNGYGRPKYLRTTGMKIKPGQTIEFTSPYGGPIQIGFAGRDNQVQFKFENVGQHAYWGSPADDASFAEILATENYNWAEVASPNFEIHSKLSKMRKTLENVNWSTASELAAAANQYTHSNAHALAGYKGPEIKVIAEVKNFIDEHNWNQATMDGVKHMNADIATCGAGCSGNPYDANWNYSPIGHGDLHELGHGLEKSRFRFQGATTHSSTNFYSYYSKSLFAEEKGTAVSCKSKPFEKYLALLKASEQHSDSFQYMVDNLDLAPWNAGATLTLQMYMAAENSGALESGWHLLPLMHIGYREYSSALSNSDTWESAKHKIGMEQLSRTEAKGMKNNDFIMTLVSFILKRDMRAYFDMWGLPTTDMARDQVAAHGFPVMPTRFYNAKGNNYCETLNHEAIDINP